MVQLVSILSSYSGYSLLQQLYADFHCYLYTLGRFEGARGHSLQLTCLQKVRPNSSFAPLIAIKYPLQKILLFLCFAT